MTEETKELKLKKELEEEGKINCQSLLQEIEPLIKDYFICDICLTSEGLKLKFLNGQTFLLTVSEEKQP